MAIKIAELDFGMGNIRSLQKAFEYLGHTVQIVKDADQASGADMILLPGDGAFGKAMENMRKLGFDQVVRDAIFQGKPVLGVCIGFQVLFENSDEFETTEKGYGVFPGNITRFPENQNLEVPHMGWNNVSFSKPSPLFNKISGEAFFYFVHSYRHNGIHQNALGVSDYGGEFTCIVQKDNVLGLQFHPEKSYLPGLQLLQNYMEMIQ